MESQQYRKDRMREREQVLLDRYIRFAAFFSDRDYAMDLCSLFPDWKDHGRREWELEYDFLFSGTDGNRAVPLWASVAKGEQVLLNETTCQVIRFYHKWGYEPQWIDGNPPDFIGEQLRFAAYLTAARLNGQEEREGERLTDAREEFIWLYLLDTAGMAWREGKKATDYAAFEKILSLLIALLADTGEEVDDPDFQVLDRGKLPGRGWQDGLKHGLHPRIADQEVREISTAGINNCGGLCIIRPAVCEGCILNIGSDPENRFPSVRACVRGRGYRKTFLNPGRLRYPMKRVGKRGEGKFERISWDEAVEEIAGQWVRIRDKYGPGSRYVAYGWGVTGIMRPNKLAKRLLALDGGYLDDFNTYSSACMNEISPYIYGTNSCENSPQDLLNTRYLILWGDNSAETIFGTERNYFLSLVKKKGVRIVAIDPRQSQTAAAFADEWIAIRPSTDSALADAMAYVIWSEHLQDQEFMDRYCLGFDEAHMPDGVPGKESYYAYLFGIRDGIEKTPEWASGITGISPETIRRIAREYALAKPACILPGLGPQRHGNGEQAVRGMCMLACLTGNVGIPGGGSGGAGDLKEHQKITLFTDRAVNPYPGRIPVFLWTKAVEKGTEMTGEEDRLEGVSRLDSSIKMIFNLAGNTLINQHSDINRTRKLLEDETKCEFILCSDIFMTPSARFADILLPATSVFEGNNISAPWRGNNFLLKNNQVINPLFSSRFEWEWLKETAEKLGLFRAFTEGKPDPEQWLEENYEILRKAEPELPSYREFSRLGGYRYRDQVSFIAFQKERTDPDRYPFCTPSGKIEIFSKRLYDMGKRETVPAIPGYVPCPEGPGDPLAGKYPLQLIGWHTKRRCHSIHDQNEWQEELERQELWIHPADAKKRGIRDGDQVLVWNDRGSIRMPAKVTGRIMEGVIAMAQGGWYRPGPDGTDMRGSINVLTSQDHPTPLAKGNPQHTNLADVRRWPSKPAGR